MCTRALSSNALIAFLTSGSFSRSSRRICFAGITLLVVLWLLLSRTRSAGICVSFIRPSRASTFVLFRVTRRVVVFAPDISIAVTFLGARFI